MELEQENRAVICTKATIKTSDKSNQLNVCVYCRVSAESDEQDTSYTLQQKYYENKINENPNWRFAEIYGEKVSKTSPNKRAEFMKMIRKCRKKKIDLVITKSIYQFAKDLTRTLKYIKELKELGIGIYFEKENINTLDAKSELIIMLLTSLSQEKRTSTSRKSIPIGFPKKEWHCFKPNNNYNT